MTLEPKKRGHKKGVPGVGESLAVVKTERGGPTSISIDPGMPQQGDLVDPKTINELERRWDLLP